MAAVASNFAPTVTVKVYKNGNRNFLGKTIVINRRHIRTMEALYDEVTSHIAAFNAVRKICTPIGGRPVQSLENIRNKSVYVAAGREVFKKLNYADLGISKPRPPRKTNNAPKRTVIVTEGRHKMDYEWGKRDLKIIHVFCNGDEFKPSVKIVLQKRLQQSMEQILNIVQEHVFVAAAIAALYTIDGKLVLTPEQLVTGQNYVAVERGRFFKRANYGGAASSLSRSPRAPFLPQIGNGQLTNKEGGLPRKNIAKRKPRVAKTNIENKTSEHSPRDQTRDQSRVTTETEESPRDVVSNLSPDPPAVNSLLRASQDNFTISASPPGQLEDDTPVQDFTSPIAEDGNDDNLAVGDVFKASGLLQEKADEVKDTRQTKEEKPIDLLPAEEVTEEVLEQVEDARKTSGDEDQDGNKHKAVEEVEDDVETIEDDPKLNETPDKVDKLQMQAWQHDETESGAVVDSSKEKEHSRLSQEAEREEPSTSSKINDDNSAADAVPSEQRKKDGESGRMSSSAGKAESRADKEEDRNTPPSSEPEKSEDEDDSEDTEEDEDEEEKNAAKDESNDQASDSNNNDKNSAPDKGPGATQNADKTSYIS